MSGRDHPREYGENQLVCGTDPITGGPSPRIRGKSAGLWYRPYHWGTIPANTGKMPASSPLNAETRDHPREYGENLSKTDEVAGKQGSSPRIRGKWSSRHEGNNTPYGSSPRIRGKLWPRYRNLGGSRIIPANTGKITVPTASHKNARDHPREYGENPISLRELLGPEGSSPRIRGKCPSGRIEKPHPGIIPANTGKIAPNSL